MSGTLGLTALNKSSCKVATFAVRMFGGAVGSYTFKSRSNGADCTMYKFEAILIGTDASAYLRGYVKGTAAQAREASKKFRDGSCWLLSKTVLDSFTNAAFISTPVPHRVDLAKSTLTPASLDTLPTHPVPPRTVADLAVITTNRSTDLLAVIKEATELRLSGKGVPIVDVTLIDGSTLPTGSTAGASQPGAAKATIVVSVWGVDKAKQMQAHVGDAMEFFGLAVSMKEGKKQINHFPEESLAAAPDCAKAIELTRAKDELVAARDTKMLTSEWVPNSVGVDVSGPQPLGCAAFLNYTAEAPQAHLPSIIQLPWVFIEEPEGDATVTTSSAPVGASQPAAGYGSRLWYITQARDVSGAASVGMPQRCALELSGASGVEVFCEKKEQGALNMPLFCHIRVSRKHRNSGASQPTASELGTRVFVNHTIEAVEAVTWGKEAVPNASYEQILALLNLCPRHDEG